MIERHWKGIAKKERANDYIAHLTKDTFKQLATIEGFLSAKILKRDVKDGVEFLIITEWRTSDVIRQFAGTNPHKQWYPNLFRK